MKHWCLFVVIFPNNILKKSLYILNSKILASKLAGDISFDIEFDEPKILYFDSLGTLDVKLAHLVREYN